MRGVPGSGPSEEELREIRRMLLDGWCVNEIARKMHIGRGKVREVKRTVVLPNCACGRPHGHKGGCLSRRTRSPVRPSRRFTRTAADRAARSARSVGIPTKGTPEEIAAIRAQPLSVRRLYRRARIGLSRQRIGRDANLRPGEVDPLISFFAELIMPEPTPLQRLIEKEEHEQWLREERRYWLWRIGEQKEAA